MSSKPYPEGATKTLEVVRRINTIASELPELIAAANRLKQLQEERGILSRELKELLDSMDCDRPGNFGWEGRFGWLIAEVVRQADSTNNDADRKCGKCDECEAGIQCREFPDEAEKNE